LQKQVVGALERLIVVGVNQKFFVNSYGQSLKIIVVRAAALKSACFALNAN
jgi:hypothetical protein